MTNFKLTAVLLITAITLSGCGTGADTADNTQAARNIDAVTESRADGQEAFAGQTPSDGQEAYAGQTPSDGQEAYAGQTPSDGQEAFAGQDSSPDKDQRQTVIGELYKLPKEKADWKGLTYQEKSEDFDYLYQTLKENFPYLALIKRANGVDMDQEYEEFRARVEKTETDMQFFVLIQQFISKGGGIGHLDLLTPDFYDRMAEAYQQEDGIPEEELPRMKLLAKEYANEASASAYSAMSDVFQETMDQVNACNAARTEPAGDAAAGAAANRSRRETEVEGGLIHMEYINVTKENLEKEHICCAISSNKDVQVSSKKEWLSDRMDDGLVFLKSVERGKCFIEYIPAENAWIPIVAQGYMVINCLWVSGSFKGNGYSSDLLKQCVTDSKEKGKKGLCILSSAKKKPFLADPKFLAYKGFSVCDQSDNGIQLWYLPFGEGTSRPQFRECARHPHVEEPGYVLYYTSQCPFNAKYVPVLEKTAKENGIPFHAIHITDKDDAQNAPTPITTYALFCNGAYLTNEELNDKKFLKMAQR